jgi:hypothetical protein
MKIVKANIGNWHIQCIPEEGARISVLQYAGRDLLTANPPAFKAPEVDHGEYETRPVYGYDDCFPSVDQCKYPDDNTTCRDHGELCWLKWQVKLNYNKLDCYIDCPRPKVTFKRMLEFIGNTLKWKFEVINISDTKLAFLHVMHALMPRNEIQNIELPRFSNIVDENNSVELDFKSPHEIASHLVNIHSGNYKMLLMKNINQGFIHLDFKKGLRLKIHYDHELFPTIGIWWNHSGYPDEKGLQRDECAFEPIPGTSSNLINSIKNGYSLHIEPAKTIHWKVTWEIEQR